MDTIGIKGIITIHEIPDWSDEELAERWARMSAGEKRSRQVPLNDGRMQAENLITNVGITQLLNNISVAGQGNMQAFAQVLAVGNGTITGVMRTDTGVNGAAWTSGTRKIPASFSITGFSTTIVTNFASGDAVGTWTSIGLYGYNPTTGQNAQTATITGQLNTHALFAFTKGSSAYAVNYIFLLSN